MGKEESSTKNKPAIREEREALEEIPMPQAYRFHNVVENSIPLIRSNSDSEIISKGTKYSGSWQCTLCFHVNADTVKQVCAMCGTPTGGDSRMTPRQQKIVHGSEEPPKEEPPLVDEKGNSLLGVKEETEEDAAEQKKSQKALDLSVPDMASDMTDILDNNNDNSSNDNNNGITMSTPNSDNILYSNKSNNQSCERLSILDSSDEENDELLFTANGVEPNYYSSSTTAAQKRQGGDGTAAQEFSFNGDTTTNNNDNDDDLQLCIDSAIAPLFSQTKTTTTTTATTKAPPHVQVEISDIESNISAEEEEDNFVFENKVQTSRKVWILRLAFLSLVFLVVLLSLLLVRK